MTELIANLTSRLSGTSPTPSNRPSDDSSNADQDSDTMSTKTRHESLPPRPIHAGPSPRVKSLDELRTNLNPKPPPPDQDKSAQYNEDRTPDAGDT
jgi:hypothetical protein